VRRLDTAKTTAIKEIISDACRRIEKIIEEE
jgi:hypothetical protein